MKSRSMGWEYIQIEYEKREFLVRKSEVKDQLDDLNVDRKMILIMVLKIVCEGAEWIKLVMDSERGRGLNMVKILEIY
jgi:hypothetical protein